MGKPSSRVQEFAATALKEVGEGAQALVRGGAYFPPAKDFAPFNERWRAEMDKERHVFLQGLSSAGFPESQCGVAWAADEVTTQIIYDTNTETLYVLTDNPGESRSPINS